LVFSELINKLANSNDANDKELPPNQKNHVSLGRQKGVKGASLGNNSNIGVNVGIKMLKVKGVGA